MAIVLDNRVREVAGIDSAIRDSGELVGGFTKEQANDLSLMLRENNCHSHAAVLFSGNDLLARRATRYRSWSTSAEVKVCTSGVFYFRCLRPVAVSF